MHIRLRSACQLANGNEAAKSNGCKNQDCGSAHFNVNPDDPDPPQLFISMVSRIRIQLLFNLMRTRIRIMLLIKVIVISDHWFIDPPRLYFEPPGVHCERPGPSTALNLQNLEFNVEPDKDIYSNADLGETSKNNEDPCGSTS
jgi:hypothetical protein